MNKLPSWLCRTRSLVFSGLYYMVAAASHKTPYLNMGDAEEAPQAAPPNQGTTNSLPFPTKFDGTSKLNQADLWPKWLRRFERYRIASGLQNKHGTRASRNSSLCYGRMCQRYYHNTARKRRNRFVYRRQSSTQRLPCSATEHHSRTSTLQHTKANT